MFRKRKERKKKWYEEQFWKNAQEPWVIIKSRGLSACGDTYVRTAEYPLTDKDSIYVHLNQLVMNGVEMIKVQKVIDNNVMKVARVFEDAKWERGALTINGNRRNRNLADAGFDLKFFVRAMG